MRNIKEKRGITLITLAVTIVVILILAGVTIDVTLGENGILNKSKEAANRMNNLVKEDETELNELLNELNETMDSNWNSNIEIPDGNNEEGGNTETGGEDIGDLIDNGTIGIGDYIAYKPAGDTSYTVSGTYSGTGSDQVINKENLNWRVLDKTEDGRVRLISAAPTNATVKLQGANGYNNAVYLLDELCNTLYKGENATAQNLKIEDIQNKMNLSYWDFNNATYYGETYSPTYRDYPLIFAEEKEHIIDGKTGTLGISEQKSLITETNTASTWTVKWTEWNNNMNVSNYTSKIYYELYHNGIKDVYWLSSRCVRANMAGAVSFHIRQVDKSNIQGQSLYYSRENLQNEGIACIRPVILLDSNVQIDTSVEGKDGKTPETAYVIK